MKRVRYLIEAALVRSLIFGFGLMPVEMASATGGTIARFIGPKLSASRKAKRHVMNSLHVEPQEAERIIQGMWENLGRVFAEYPHLPTIYQHHVEVVGEDIAQDLAQTYGPILFFSGHLANWEVGAPSLRRFNIDVDLIYRPPNNPFVENILQKCRSMQGALKTYPKSSAGMRLVMGALKNDRRIGILIDQKYNQGVEARFFGQPAMTSPAFIQLAQKFNCPLIPVQVERIKGPNFRVTIHPSLDVSKPVDALIEDAHRLLEEWITARPEQWLWIHRRWKSSVADQ